MSGNNELFDLSLFADSPTNDRRFTTHLSELHYHGEPSTRPVEQRPPVPAYIAEYLAEKPLPPLPHRRVCPGVSVPRNGDPDYESRCILSRIKRNVTPPNSRENTLLQRRNPTSAPQLTLTVPSSNTRNRSPASAMIWMPDEQMWLIADDVRAEPARSQTAYPSPPDYSYREYPRSEPLPVVRPHTSLTPPLTPLQSQLLSLYEPRDEERLSPLFQQAMNSVPMMDLSDLCSHSPEPLSAPAARPRRSQTSPEHSMYNPSPMTPTGLNAPARSVSVGSRTTLSRSNTTNRSYHSARESVHEDLTVQMNSARRWQGLARRIARPSSAR